MLLIYTGPSLSCLVKSNPLPNNSEMETILPERKLFETLLEKGEKAGNQQFLPFPRMFKTLSQSSSVF